MTNTNLSEKPRHEFEEASPVLRLGNLIIDLTFFYVVAGTFLGLLIAFSEIGTLIYNLHDIPSLLDLLLALIVFGLYSWLSEGIFKGRSVGKFVTGTKAIREDGQPFEWGDAFGRGFVRMIPFEILSGIGGYPWHDKWTDTRVVKIKK